MRVKAATASAIIKRRRDDMQLEMDEMARCSVESGHGQDICTPLRIEASCALLR